MNTSTRGTGGRGRAGTILIYLLSFVLVGSAVVKFVQIPKVALQMAAMGFEGSRLTFIAVLEVASAILFVYPRTRSLGLLMVSAYLGGAIATHVGHNQPPFPPAIVLALFWLAAWLRHPEVLWSINRTPS
jgi:hypothetical protein